MIYSSTILIIFSIYILLLVFTIYRIINYNNSSCSDKILNILFVLLIPVLGLVFYHGARLLKLIFKK